MKKDSISIKDMEPFFVFAYRWRLELLYRDGMVLLGGITYPFAGLLQNRGCVYHL